MSSFENFGWYLKCASNLVSFPTSSFHKFSYTVPCSLQMLVSTSCPITAGDLYFWGFCLRELDDAHPERMFMGYQHPKWSHLRHIIDLRAILASWDLDVWDLDVWDLDICVQVYFIDINIMTEIVDNITLDSFSSITYMEMVGNFYYHFCLQRSTHGIKHFSANQELLTASSCSGIP